MNSLLFTMLWAISYGYLVPVCRRVWQLNQRYRVYFLLGLILALLVATATSYLWHVAHAGQPIHGAVMGVAIGLLLVTHHAIFHRFFRVFKSHSFLLILNWTMLFVLALWPFVFSHVGKDFGNYWTQAFGLNHLGILLVLFSIIFWTPIVIYFLYFIWAIYLVDRKCTFFRDLRFLPKEPKTKGLLDPLFSNFLHRITLFELSL